MLISDFGIVLWFVREGQDVSQAELGRRSAVSPNLINDYEHGRKTPTRERLEYLLSFMGIPPERVDETLQTLAANRASSRAPHGPTGYLSATRRRIEAVVQQAGGA